MRNLPPAPNRRTTMTDADLPVGALTAWAKGTRFVHLCPDIGETIRLSPLGAEMVVTSRDAMARTFRTHDNVDYDVETPWEHVRYWGEQKPETD